MILNGYTPGLRLGGVVIVSLLSPVCARPGVPNAALTPAGRPEVANDDTGPRKLAEDDRVSKEEMDVPATPDSGGPVRAREKVGLTYVNWLGEKLLTESRIPLCVARFVPQLMLTSLTLYGPGPDTAIRLPLKLKVNKLAPAGTAP